MGTFVLIAIAVFLVAGFINFIINKNKQGEFEKNLSSDIIKSKQLYSDFTLYKDQQEEKTIIRFFIGGKTYTIAGFIPDDELKVHNTLVLFDKIRKKMAIMKDIRKYGYVIVIPFSDIISLQPVQVSNTKVISRGKVLPISKTEYSWAGGRTKTLKKIESVYIEIKYRVGEDEMSYKLTYHEGYSNGDSKDYDKIIRATNIHINKINHIIASHLI